jgi:hypothetical protein
MIRLFEARPVRLLSIALGITLLIGVLIAPTVSAQSNQSDGSDRSKVERQKNGSKQRAGKDSSRKKKRRGDARKAHRSPELEEAISKRRASGEKLFDSLGMETGRIVMLPVTKMPPKTSGRVKGTKYKKVRVEQLEGAAIRPGTTLTVFERDETGNVSSRSGLIAAKGGKLLLLDEGMAGEKRRPAGTKKRPKRRNEQKGDRNAQKQKKKKNKKGDRSGITTRGAGSTGQGSEPIVVNGDPIIVEYGDIDEATSGPSVEDEALQSLFASVVSLAGGPPPTQGVLLESQPVIVVGSEEDIARDQLTLFDYAIEKGANEDWDLGTWEEPPPCYDVAAPETKALGFSIDSSDCGRKAEPGQVWYGTAPFCEATSDTCLEHGMAYVASDSVGEGAQCLSGKKVLCEPLAEGETIEVWIGTAPACSASAKDCANAGLEFVKSSKKGDGKKCVTGEKVLCRTPTATVSTSSSSTASSASSSTAAAPAVSTPKTQVWVGKAPFCKASRDDCEDMGMNYVKSNKKGDGNKCTSGTKVLCESR